MSGMAPYPIEMIEQAIAAATAFSDVSRARKARAFAAMRDMRDSAPSRVGAYPDPADVQMALNLRARDVLGLSDPAGWWQS